MILDNLSSKNVANRGIFNQKTILKDYKLFLKNGAENTFHIWQWVNIEKFFQVFIDGHFKTEFNSYEIELCKLH